PRPAPRASTAARASCTTASGTLAARTPAMSGPRRGSAGLSEATRPQPPTTANRTAPTVDAIRFEVISVVRARLDAELGTRGVVEGDDLAPDLRTLAELRRPRHAQLLLHPVDGVTPDAAEVVEVDHPRRLRLAPGEGAHDEHAVVAVVVVHVVQNGVDDLGGENGHPTTLIHGRAPMPARAGHRLLRWCRGRTRGRDATRLPPRGRGRRRGRRSPTGWPPRSEEHTSEL